MAKTTKRKTAKARVTATAKKSAVATSKRRTPVKTKSVRKHGSARKATKTTRLYAPSAEPAAVTPQNEAQPSPPQLMLWPVLPLTMMTMWMAPMRAAFGR